MVYGAACDFTVEASPNPKEINGDMNTLKQTSLNLALGVV